MKSILGSIAFVLHASILGCGASSPQSDSAQTQTVTAGSNVPSERQSQEPVLGAYTDTNGATDKEKVKAISSIVNSQMEEQKFGEAVFE